MRKAPPREATAAPVISGTASWFSSNPPAAAATEISRANGSPPRQISQSTPGRSTTTVSTRTIRFRFLSVMSPGRSDLRAGLAETALALLEVLQREQQIELAEV